MIGVAQRTADDCGVACLATLLDPMSWAQSYHRALWALFPQAIPCAPPALATSEYRIRRALSKLAWKLSRKSGVPNIEGERGLILSQTNLEFGCASHWLAWERDDQGRIMVWNPQGQGELFEYKPGSLHNRGLRLTWWANVTRKAKAQ